MAAQQAQIFSFANRKAMEEIETSSRDDIKWGDKPTQTIAKKGYEDYGDQLFFDLFDVLQDMPKYIIKPMLTLIQGLLHYESAKGVTDYEISHIQIESEPIVNAVQHSSNITGLQSLKNLKPDTENDIILLGE